MGLTATILGLVGFDALKPLPPDRWLFFSGWMQEGPWRTPS